MNKYLRVLSDFERISDHARNVGEAADEIQEKKIVLSGSASNELLILEDAVRDITEMTIDAFLNNDPVKAAMVDPLEEVIDDLCDKIKSHHIVRVSRKECTLETGFVFNDLLTDYERISDHCDNIAIDILDAGTDDIAAHEYHKQMNQEQEEFFDKYYAEFTEKYRLPKVV